MFNVILRLFNHIEDLQTRVNALEFESNRQAIADAKTEADFILDHRARVVEQGERLYVSPMLKSFGQGGQK